MNRVTNYSAEDLAIDIVVNRMSNADLAAKYDLSDRYIQDIKYRGANQEVQTLMRQIREGMLEAARRAGAQYAEALLMKHVSDALGDTGERGRKCREFLLQLMLGQPNRTSVAVYNMPGVDPLMQFVASLPAEDQEALLNGHTVTVNRGPAETAGALPEGPKSPDTPA